MNSRPASPRSQHQAPRLSDFRILVVPGLHGSGPGHWQSRWQRLYPAFERVEQEHWDQPDLPRWSQRLDERLQQSERPVVIVAHSFGCLTTVHCTARGHADGAQNKIAAALLVAPADPDKFQVASLVERALPFPALVVGSSNDPWMTAPRAAHWAAVWGADFLDAGALGHINAESGLGDWAAGQSLLQQLLAGLPLEAGYPLDGVRR
ncbi:alpha/beta hydrolase [Herbaspirillum lusitanum]|uniref:Alpha/beta hydrolase n=1 Tax=Herbaspirillum lusitanum TaxID=213312 RepID=A0ABW9A1T7_9BURK